MIKISKFSEKLIELRKRDNLSQIELARRIGVSRSRLSNYELGIREPDFEILEAFADYFNVNMDYLLGISKKERPTAEEISEPLTEEEKLIIELFRRVPVEDQRKVLAMIRAALE